MPIDRLPIPSPWRTFVLLVSCSTLLNGASPDSLSYSDQGSSITITDCSQFASGAMEIPSVINGKPVTAIGNSAFSMCKSLTRVTIPSGVTSIGNQSFYQCYGLTEIVIPATVASIGSEAFFYCDGLTSVTFGAGLKTIGASAFAYCTGVTSLTFPATVTSIGTYAFLTCSKLTKATFLGNAPPTGTGAFNEASAGFKIYFAEGKSGFTIPTWRGWQSVRLKTEISILQPSRTGLRSGNATRDFGSAKIGVTGDFKKFTIRNVGKLPLTGLSIGKTGDEGDFIVTPLAVTSLPPGATTTFKVTFKPLAKGTRTAGLRVKSNDRDENPFRISVMGVGSAK
jgi:hypothetical protein